MGKESIVSQLEKHGESTKYIIGMIHEAAQNFEVSTKTIENGLGNYNLYPRPSRMPMPMLKDGELTIKINENTRLKDIEKIWFMVNEEQKKLPNYRTKSQSNVRPDLIYAIYKQRLIDKTGKRKSFPEIFRMYKIGHIAFVCGLE